MAVVLSITSHRQQHLIAPDGAASWPIVVAHRMLYSWSLQFARLCPRLGHHSRRRSRSRSTPNS